MDAITRALLNEFSSTNATATLPDDKQFEHFAAFCVLSSKYNDEFDTADLVAGDGGDLNIDAFAIKVNGRLADDVEFIDDVLALNGYLDVEFIVIQAKTSSSFDGAALIVLGDNLRNQVFANTQTMPVNDDVKRFIAIKDSIYKNASKLRSNPTLWIYYVCTGNWAGDTYLVEAMKTKRKELLDTSLFSDVHYTPVGALHLQKLFRDTRTSIKREVKFDKLITLPKIESVQASYLGILPHGEYLKLITDDEDKLVKSVFVDNVRDFQGENPVNTDIAKTITDGAFDQFVIRNNGITIVARNIKVTSNNYTLEDYQIVNGCQTSHVLYANRLAITSALFIPVKLIQTADEEVAQSIIKSTNKQTQVEEDDLLALTQFQRDLEDYYRSVEEACRLYYERRAKQYADQTSLEKGRIISIGTQLKCFASMFIEQPNQASRYQGTLLKSVNKQVFQQNHKPKPYFISALAYYRFEVAILRLPVAEKGIKAFRFYLLLAFRYRFETSVYPGASNKRIDGYCDSLKSKLITPELSKIVFDECCEIVRDALTVLGLKLERDSAKSRALIDEVKKISSSRKAAQPLPIK
jgi:hypothetical protein